jgi:membrane-associated phospholipid phosphatase
MLFLTDFADLAVILPLAAIVAVSLAAVGWRREALAWSVAVTGTLAAILLLKLLAFSEAGDFLDGRLDSPSGHTAAGTIVYAGLLTLLGRRLATRVRIALLAGAALALLFAVTRLKVGEHSLPDVLVGAAAGLAGVLVLARLAGARPAAARGAGLLVVGAIVVLVAATLHGHRLRAEEALRAIAAEFRSGV